jgi:hypothetical protein
MTPARSMQTERTVQLEVQPSQESVSLNSAGGPLSETRPSGMEISPHLISPFLLLHFVFVTAQKWGKSESAPWSSKPGMFPVAPEMFWVSTDSWMSLVKWWHGVPAARNAAETIPEFQRNRQFSLFISC